MAISDHADYATISAGIHGVSTAWKLGTGKGRKGQQVSQRNLNDGSIGFSNGGHSGGQPTVFEENVDQFRAQGGKCWSHSALERSARGAPPRFEQPVFMELIPESQKPTEGAKPSADQHTGR